MENNRSGLPPMTWNTSATSLNISNLKPCSSYTIGVSSINMFLQPGEPSTALYTTSSIASVPSISVDYSCTNAIATVSWEAVSGARSYRAVATGNNGTSLSCTTTGTSCQITTLRCGERYAVRISSIADCESTSNISYVFETAPCPPQNPTIFRECFSNVIIFSWAPTNKTAYYIAQSVDSDGVVNECVTIDTSCYFIQTDCGLTYSFTVSSVYSGAQGCNTGSTLPVTISTAPCLPQNVRTVAMDCLSDTLMTMWNPARGALRYTVQARGNRDDFYNCTSRGTNCTMTGVNCGQSLSVWITASNNECMTDFMLVDVAETVPCAPQDISLVDTCGSFSITLRWLTSNNAIFYTAKTISADGTIRFCNTMNTECEITGLQCGQTYEAFVMSTNFICNSTDSQHIAVKTAPCTPVNVQAVKDCQSNTATVQWQGQQSGGSYTALLVDNEGGMLNCSTSRNNCSIPSLRCGHTYNITVMQNNTHCNSLPSATIQMESVPCAPKQVVGIVNCSSGSMTVGWNSSAVGVNYTTVVWSGTGGPLYCNSKEPHCSVGQLDCGKAYNVMVLAASGSCQSAPSQQITVEQVPCVPTNVSVSRVCGATSVGITWAPSTGAHTYIAIAIDTHGQRSQCVSNRTSCSIANLTCGQMYSVGVIAANDNCSSQLSQTVSLYTDPCGPTSVSGLVNCSSSTASLLWTPSPNALGYIGRLESYGDVRTCNVSTVGCQISGLLCGQRYSFSVFATDGSCASAQTAPIQLDTAPCAPQNVSTVLACDTNSVTVSWSPSAVPQNYIASAVWSGGTALFCSSQNTSCSMQGLQCGQQYNITVAASNGNCSGPASPVQSIQTAPCIPQNVNGRVACGSSSLVASWDAAPGANGYIATLSASGKFPQMCVTGNLSCVFSGLQCASRYSLSVTSQNGICNNTNSSVTTLSTGPCDPQNVTAILQCSSSIATVMWSASTGASKYTVLAQTDGEQTLAASCSTSSTSCQLTSLTCGKTFNITVLAGDATCNSTSQSRAVVVTAPCLPTILSTSLDCATNAALLSWTPVRNAIRYIVNATSTNGLMSSCISPNFNCSLTGLQCGQTYSVYATARGEQCDSSPSTSVTVITAPCSPSMVNAYYDCRNNTALIGWNNNNASTLFVALLEGDGYSDTCSTTGTNCSITGLRCGRAYNVTVKAVSSNCNSSYSQPTGIQTVPCATQNVSASWQCSNSSAVVVWAPTAGVSLYSVTALGRDGDVKQCNSTTSTCQLSQMHCGQIYNITVTPYTNNCSGVRSTAVSFSTGPCAPSNLSVVLQCQGNQGIASWLPAVWADSYVATATALDGHTHTCASNTTSCSFTELHCGETYSVTVVTLISGCPSDPSVAVAIRTVPCVPVNVSASVDCSTNTGNISWGSATGAVVYNTKLVAGNGRVAFCSTSGTSCVVMLECGQNYSAVVVASTDVCNSSQSSSLQFRSAPCAPTGLNVTATCNSNTTSVAWNPSSGIVAYYVASAEPSSGLTLTCNSSSTSCDISGLICGQTYNVSVTAYGGDCVGRKSLTYTLKTAPCAPQTVQFQLLTCQSGNLSVVWQPTSGALMYRAEAVTFPGHLLSCYSAYTSCIIPALGCGQTYDISVVAVGDSCNSSSSAIRQASTAPCPPSSVTAVVNCSTNTPTVSWNASSVPGAVYTARAVTNAASSSGMECNSTNSSCALTGLHCSTQYNVTVIATKDNCMSAPSAVYSFFTAPCMPDSSSVSVQVDCATDTALLSWAFSAGVDNYTAVVLGSGGHFNSCSTQQNQCNVSLLCGQSYNLTLISINQQCQIPTVINTTFQSRPCEPVGIAVNMTCGTSSAVVSWRRAQGVDYYIAHAVRGGDGHEDMCISNSSSCLFSSLACGQNYTFTVTAYMGHCSSNTSQPAYISTAPCVPSGLVSASGCGSAGAVLSWNSSAGADVYVVNGWSRDGHTVSLRTSLSTISLPDLHCSQEYNLIVTAINQQCNSTPSLPVRLQTGPCSAATVSAVLDCMSSVAVVSWQPNNGTAIYTATLLDSSGPLRSCVGVGSQCNISGLACGKNYSISVTVSNDQCNSTTTLPTSLQSVPCVPVNISVITVCVNSSAVVVWDRSQGAISYYVNAVSSNGNVSCQSTSPTCTLTNLTCGSTYYVHVVAVGNNCSSMPSQPMVISSVPCKPTNVSVDVQCANDIAVLSWAAQTGAVQYFATAQSDSATPLYCQTTNTSCTLQGLPCGAVYNFTVQASNGDCNSSYSKTLTGGGVPCPPASFRVVPSVLVGQGQLLRAYWSIVNCPNSHYLLEVSGSIQGDPHSLFQMTSYSTNRTYFETPVPCSSTYNTSVRAQNSGGTSVPSAIVTGISVPCPPLSVTFTGSNSSAVVAWNASLYATEYHVYQVTSNGQIQVCNTSQLSCPVTNVSSNLIMVTARNAAGEGAGTSDVRVIAARRRRDLTQTEMGELTSPQASFTMVTADAVWLEWTHVEGADFYSLLIREQSRSSKPVVMTVYGEASIIPELKPATMYCVSLSARNSYSSAPYSEPACVETAALS
uniref:Fibronectin type-III domain-containing protein n=1 Tax=Pygocentrus nattereri TaxID=42514 RepID=A0A3B4CMI2_PYGNA